MEPVIDKLMLNAKLMQQPPPAWVVDHMRDPVVELMETTVLVVYVKKTTAPLEVSNGALYHFPPPGMG